MTDYFSPENSKKRERIITDLLGKEILDGASMSRLRKISFLGVLNVAARVPESLRFSRYDHSISAAYLTWLYCQNLKLPDEVSLTATLLALIHDISQPPFSHSAEIYLRIRSGVLTQHTSALTNSKIAKIIKDGYDTFPDLLRKNGIEGLSRLLYNLTSRAGRKEYHPYITNILDAPFCPDTFDGINRAWHALNTEGVKFHLSNQEFTSFEALDPSALVHFISSTDHPFAFKSAHPPTKNNPIFKFHSLMRSLYNNVIYSDWQSFAMVMFARALESAYKYSKKFDFTHKNDVDVLKMIERNPTSKAIFFMMVKGHTFYLLSKENPSLYKLSLNYYTEAMGQGVSYVVAKGTIEAMVANKLEISTELVFWHQYRPLVWSSDNIQFHKFGKADNLWMLKWDSSEGEPSIETEIEIYYTTAL